MAALLNKECFGLYCLLPYPVCLYFPFGFFFFVYLLFPSFRLMLIFLSANIFSLLQHRPSCSNCRQRPDRPPEPPSAVTVYLDRPTAWSPTHTHTHTQNKIKKKPIMYLQTTKSYRCEQERENRNLVGRSVIPLFACALSWRLSQTASYCVARTSDVLAPGYGVGCHRFQIHGILLPLLPLLLRLRLRLPFTAVTIVTTIINITIGIGMTVTGHSRITVATSCIVGA